MDPKINGLFEQIQEFYSELEFSEQIQKVYDDANLAKTKTKNLEKELLEEKASLSKKIARGLLKLTPSIMGGVGAYLLSHYGFKSNSVQSIGLGVVGAFSTSILHGIYNDIRNR